MCFWAEIKIIGMQVSMSRAVWSWGVIYLLASGRKLASLPVHGALEEVDDALERQDALALYQALQDPILALRCLQRDNLDCYLEQLSVDREQKALVGAGRAQILVGGWLPRAAVVPSRRGASLPGRGWLCGPAAFCRAA